MSDRHLIGLVRERFNEAIAQANITTTTSGASNLLTQVPSGYVIPAAKLPVIYVLLTQENVVERSNQTEMRSLRFDVGLVVQEKGEPQDQLEELQLGVELAIAGSNQLGGIALACRYLGCEIVQHQGEYQVGRRNLKFEIILSMTANDPRV